MTLLLLSGEESGNLYADMIRARLAGHEIRVYADYGFTTGELAVMGFWPVLKRLPFFLKVASRMKRVIDEWKPDVLCTVDYPGMNLKLAAYAKARGIKCVHVVCPQVWAWKRGRVPKIERSVDRICCFFPFEPKLFEGTGLDAVFIGHPLVKVVVMTPLHKLDEDNPLGDGSRTLPTFPLSQYVKAIREVSEYYSIPVLDLYATSGLRPEIPVIQELYMPDGLHPNDRGHEILTTKLEAFLRNL